MWKTKIFTRFKQGYWGTSSETANKLLADCLDEAIEFLNKAKAEYASISHDKTVYTSPGAIRSTVCVTVLYK